MIDEDELQSCPHCPDGYVWNSQGQTGKTCPTCKGHAVVNLDGSALTTDEPFLSFEEDEE